MWTGRAKLMGVTQTNGSPKTGLFLLCFWFVLSKDAQSFFCVQKPLPLFLWPWPHGQLSRFEKPHIRAKQGADHFWMMSQNDPERLIEKHAPELAEEIRALRPGGMNGVDVGEIAG